MGIGNASIDGNLRDAFDILEREIKLSLNCHAIGKIESFDSTKQTAQVSVLYKRTMLNANGKVSHEDYPVLADVPVIVLAGGASGVSLPIAQGDECLVLFNDRDIDGWFSSGQSAELLTPRLHSMSDGIALVGLRSAGRVLTTYDSTRAVLFNGTTVVGVGASLVKIANATTTLGTILQSLMTTLASLTVQTADGTVVSTVNAASLAQLNLVKTQLQGLLE